MRIVVSDLVWGTSRPDWQRERRMPQGAILFDDSSSEVFCVPA